MNSFLKLSVLFLLVFSCWYLKLAKKLEEETIIANKQIQNQHPDENGAVYNNGRHQNQNSAHRYRVYDYHTDGSGIKAYIGRLTAEEFAKWTTEGRPALAPAVKTLETAEEVKTFSEDSETAVVGFFSNADSTAAKEFLKAAVEDSVDDLPFAVVYKSLGKGNKIYGNAVVVFKKLDSGRRVRDELTTDFQVKKIVNFIRVSSLPLIVDYNQSNVPKIFRDEVRSHVVLFLSKKAGHYEKYVGRQKRNAKDFLDKILFVTVNVDEGYNGYILEEFRIKREDAPAVRFYNGPATGVQIEIVNFQPQIEALNDEFVMKAFIDRALYEKAIKTKLHSPHQTQTEQGHGHGHYSEKHEL